MISPIYRLFFAPRLPPILRTPSDRFKNLPDYDFKANFAELSAGGGIKWPRMHYLDEGLDPNNAHNQEIILCLHGEPTWSFLYRKMIPGFVRAGYRVIVPDFIGFGKSDKYTCESNYTYGMHATALRLLLDHLNINKNVTLVVQDWGGLVGLSILPDIPETFNSLVIMNTGLPIGDLKDDMGKPSNGTMDMILNLRQSLPFLVWRSMVQLFGRSLPLHQIFTYGNGFSKEVVKGYTAPFPDYQYAAGAAQWPLLVPVYKDDPVAYHMISTRNYLKTWTKPALVMFGDSDPFTAGQEKLFLNLIPGAKFISIPGASHLLQETHGEDLTDYIIKFKQGAF